MSGELKGREFEIASQVAELLDTLTPDQQKQIMAMLITRYGVTVKRPLATTRQRSYGPKGKPKSW